MVIGVVPLGPKLLTKADLHVQQHIPVHFIYGGPDDWMESCHGVAVVDQVRAVGVLAECTVLSEAGHHVMLDDPDGFNAAVLRAAAANVS